MFAVLLGFAFGLLALENQEHRPRPFYERKFHPFGESYEYAHRYLVKLIRDSVSPVDPEFFGITIGVLMLLVVVYAVFCRRTPQPIPQSKSV
jgi:hypothetical protein